jgi:hypothetical protein
VSVTSILYVYKIFPKHGASNEYDFTVQTFLTFQVLEHRYIYAVHYVNLKINMYTGIPSCVLK